MPTTATYLLPYPAAGDPADVPTDMQELADRLETVLPTIGAGYGTSLPGSPTDGQEYILVDSTTAPTYQWRFRYNAGSSQTEKWEFVGGAPALSTVATLEGTTSATYAALTTAGPSIVIPQAGVYAIELGAQFEVSGGSGVAASYMSYDIGATGAVDADGAFISLAQAAYTLNAVKAQRKTLTAVTLTAKYRRLSGSATARFIDRFMRVTPVRVT